MKPSKPSKTDRLPSWAVALLPLAVALLLAIAAEQGWISVADRHRLEQSVPGLLERALEPDTAPVHS